MRFLFLINHQLINTIKQEAFQQNQVQLPVQIVNQTPQKQHANSKSQKTTTIKSEKSDQNIEQQKMFEEQQKLFEEQQKQKLIEQQKRLMENQRQKMLQQQQDELEQQLKLLEAEEKEHNQRQQHLQ